MSSKKQRKEKQRMRDNHDKLHRMKKPLLQKEVNSFEFEPWMGNSFGTFYRLDQIYDALDFKGTVENANLIGRNISCPSEVTIIDFNKDHVRYEMCGRIQQGASSSYIVKVYE